MFPFRTLYCVGLRTHQPLWVILCILSEKGRKEIEEMKARNREERNRNESEKTEEIKTFPRYPSAKRIAGLAQLEANISWMPR